MGEGRGAKDLKECTQFFLTKTRDTKALQHSPSGGGGHRMLVMPLIATSALPPPIQFD